ncbi:MAG: phosphodiesterase [Hyphomicrobiaceae bacterium]
MKIIHVTDPHLVAPGEQLWSLDTTARLDACLADIARWHSDATFCVISGDLADKGDPLAYQWLKTRLESFPIKTFLMMGNHDDRDVFLTVHPDAACDDNGFVQQSCVTEHGTFLFLDTLKGGGVSEGQYCADRRAWLVRTLEQAGDQPVYIFMHHPPCDIGMPYMDRIKLEEADAFADALKSGTNVRHIFFGHVHRAAYINWQGIACTCLPGTNHQVPLVRESVGARYSHEPPGYGVVLFNGAQIAVHVDAYLNRTPVAGT